MKPEHACKPPQHILGLMIRSRTRIYVSYVIPNVLELLVYIVQIVADCAVSFQHFQSHQADFGWATLSLILVPPVVTCALVLSSASQWIKPKQDGTRVKFVGRQLLQMLMFPIFVIYRFAKRVFWSIEALFHDDDDAVRMECLEMAEECSTCELYRLVQAYGQSAPQIILQLYHMLTTDLFRNFETTNVQAMSLVFSAIDLACITTTYQRFESQKQVGRHYPWSTEQQIHATSLKIHKNKCYQEECLRKKQNSERNLNKFPESDKIMENFRTRNQNNSADSYKTQENISRKIESLDHVDNEAGDEQTALLATHLTDDDKIKTKPSSHPNADEFDKVPNTPPPLPPQSTTFDNCNTVADAPQLYKQTSCQNSIESNKRRSKAFSQLETFRDMLLLNAQLYIKDNVPRPPKILIKRVEDNNTNHVPETPPQAEDVIDFFLPGPTKVVKGIEQDDFAAKTIAFFGWTSFVVMRMLSLAAFCVFFPKAFLIIMGVHYLLMLAALFLESHCKGKLNRVLFYFLLAYVYVYVLLEFRIKFKYIRTWFVGYFLLSMAENLTMTMIWYAREEFESWWFGFIFEGIIYSGILFMATIIVYYLILRPKDIVFLVEDKSEGNTPNN